MDVLLAVALYREGVVRWKFVETDDRVRPTNEMILHALTDID